MAYNESPVTVPRFVIVRGMDNTFTFHIKARGALDPLELTDNDTFLARVRDRHSSEELVEPIPLTIGDKWAGEITLTIDADTANILKRSTGSRADRSYLRAYVSIYIEASTAKQGDFVLRLEDVYVD